MVKQKKLIDEHNFKIVLQQLAETEYIDTTIDQLDFDSFSNDKTMFEYQTLALQNAFKMLFTYFNNFEEDKLKFYTQAYRKYPHANLDYSKPSDLLLEYFQPTGNRIEFHNFINRMGFWMTMGSGKTIVIIKLIELIDKAMNLGLIPKKNIMFFTANQGLLERFLKEVEDYNILSNRKIDAITLKEYEQREKYGNIFDSQQIKLFCYRSDLLAEKRKENILDFKDYLDDGNNYVILDEAHKGDNQDSKRQQIFSVLAQRGFLFNFSATFTDERDIVTTVYNLNQAVWVKKGYGKKLFLLDNDLKSFKEKSDLNESEKQKSLIKSLILLAYAKQHKLNLKDLYHDPMMVVFTNSVNTDDADAKLFFRQINLFINNYDSTLFNEAKGEIKKEFEQTKYLVTDESGDAIHEFADELDKITYDSLKLSIFYSKKGNIEAVINSQEKGEIAFKLDSTDKPFGLLKIGDTTSWKKDELEDIKIQNTFKEDNYFKSLDSSSINILIGSRSFYEGWDTTRPNVMLFLNIGMDKDAKKFVTQSIGRGMRVESVNGSRQRLSYIDVTNKVDIHSEVKILETLFVISTNKEAIEHIINWQEEQSKGIDWQEHSLVKNNPSNKVLYMPTYKKSKIEASKLHSKKSFQLSQENKNDLILYMKNLPKEMFSLIHGFYDKSECDEFYTWVNESSALFVNKDIHYKSLLLMIEKMKKRIYVNKSNIQIFKPLENEIVHFKKIKVRRDKNEDFIKILDKTLM
ncbi:MAG: DEAD/DEAH box helicase family protein, partial [Arcobacteraceae bacterium]